MSSGIQRHPCAQVQLDSAVATIADVVAAVGGTEPVRQRIAQLRADGAVHAAIAIENELAVFCAETFC